MLAQRRNDGRFPAPNLGVVRALPRNARWSMVAALSVLSSHPKPISPSHLPLSPLSTHISPTMSAKSFRQIIGVGPSPVSASSGTTALVVIDPQGSYAKGGGLEITGIDAAQAAISSAVDTYRKVGSLYGHTC